MQAERPDLFRHSHDTTQAHGTSERRTWFVVALTGITMTVELVFGYLSGSMALVADGWHMATHVGALSLAGLAYWYARRHARSHKYTFGGGKIYALAGYTNALLLAVVAVAMIVESVLRLNNPVRIDFTTALPVAVIGLLVNLASMFVLGGDHHHGDTQHDGHHAHDDGHELEHHHAHTDHNRYGAFLHVAADAFTSVLAILALLAGLFAGWTSLDPIMGIVGAVVILHWGWGLMKSASRTLLDAVSSPETAAKIRAEVESIGDATVSDLHLWELSPGHPACIVSLATSDPLDTEHYKKRILETVRIDHLTVEVTRRTAGH